MDAASSGREVPHAIRVSEMNASLTPNDFATATALSTNRSQLVTSRASHAYDKVRDLESSGKRNRPGHEEIRTEYLSDELFYICNLILINP